jgi:hypothetical protein
MAEDRYRYDQYVDEALRGVARRVLRDIARDGLSGNHHFYISFRTATPGVEMPEYLRHRYPEEITIVLQHQFWGLEVEDKQFSVTVSFNKQNERLTVPFVALTAFVDPSVRFGLQFEELKADNAPLASQSGKPSGAGTAPATPPNALSNQGRLGAGKSNGGKLVGSSRDPSPAKDSAAKGTALVEAAPPPAGDAGKPDPNKVVTLDAFRKK